MIAARFATGLLATAVAAVGVGCGAHAPKPQTEAASAHPSETLAPLFTQVLPNAPGKTFTSAIVTFPPAARAVPHRHGDAFVYAYVLEGAVRSQLEGEPAHVYHQGENWSEQPGAHHLATENTSPTEPAKLLVVFIAKTGEQLKVDDPHSEPATQSHS
jgi:quercetin dioxygenase-like cupin family protein